jgi:hypothetical protein
MWTHPKMKKAFVGNYETNTKTKKRELRLEHRNSKGVTTGKVVVFGNHQAARKNGWIYTK